MALRLEQGFLVEGRYSGFTFEEVATLDKPYLYYLYINNCGCDQLQKHLRDNLEKFLKEGQDIYAAETARRYKGACIERAGLKSRIQYLESLLTFCEGCSNPTGDCVCSSL